MRLGSATRNVFIASKAFASCSIQHAIRSRLILGFERVVHVGGSNPELRDLTLSRAQC
jgi:hypothetical protein